VKEMEEEFCVEETEKENNSTLFNAGN